MGCTYSYLKIRVGRGDLVGVFAFNQGGDRYRRIKICTHPDNPFNETDCISYNRYYDLGEWYYYDGDREQLDRVLRDFKPETQSIQYLIGRLEAECELKKYENIGLTLCRWARDTATYAKNAIIPVSIMLIKYFFCSEASKTLPTE